jgi:uncharacterized YigZ family protein
MLLIYLRFKTIMNSEKDTYKTIEIAVGDALFKDKGSKFIGYVFPIVSEEDVKIYIDELKKKHYSARHWCYAWQLGIEEISYRANDDGEPNNSAGQPIYGQILSKDLTNVLVVIVRYFGGTKLGVGGLISAYKTTAKLILEEAVIVKKTIDVFYKLNFEYKDMNKVMRIIKEQNLHIENQIMELNCEFLISVRKKNALKVQQLFLDLRCLKIKEVTP